MLSLKYTIAVYLCLKHMACKHITYHVNQSVIGHTCLKKKWKKNTQTTLLSPSKNSNEKEKVKKQDVWETLTVTTLPSLVAISLLKVDIKIFQIFT